MFTVSSLTRSGRLARPRCLAAGPPGDARRGVPAGGGSGFDPDGYRRSRRTVNLSAWHGLLLERLPDYDAADRLDRLAAHPALGGAELLLLRARRHGRPARRI